MRDVAFAAFVLAGLITTLRFPFVGMLLWVWFSIMNPHQETFGFANAVPWNLIIAIVTISSWLISSEPKSPTSKFTTAMVVVLLAWTTLNTFFAVDPTWSWHYWNRAWKTLAMCILAGTLTTNKVRFQSLMWVVVLAIGYYGVKGGIFTFVTGGTNRVFGPPDSMLRDNNMLGLALVMTLPLFNYLRVTSDSKFIRSGLTASTVLTVAAILGTYSRAAYISLGVLAIAFWLRTKNRIAYAVFGVIVFVPLLAYMPSSFYERAESILHYNSDASFLERIDSWRVAYLYAMDHAPFGMGFYGMNLQRVWDIYHAGEMHAAHSIYFQILGEQGLVGLVLYLAIICLGLFNLASVISKTRNEASKDWLYHLGSMMQLSLIAFCVGGAAAPMDFFDLLFLWVLLSAALSKLASQSSRLPNFAETLRRDAQEIAAQIGP